MQQVSVSCGLSGSLLCATNGKPRATLHLVSERYRVPGRDVPTLSYRR